MLNINKTRHIKRPSARGDTIVEVLIAIAIAAFAIGTAYAIANRSLQEAITARERNQAVNILQSQIAALKLRFIDDGCTFSDDPTSASCAFRGDQASQGGFVVPSYIATPPPSQLPKTIFHFCLDDQSASQTDTTHPWNQQINNFATDSDADNITSTNIYNATCVRQSGCAIADATCVKQNTGSVADFFIDISAQITSTSQNLKRRTVYKFSVRWDQVGGAGTAESDVYYRL